MVTEISNVAEFINELSSNNKFKFHAKLVGNFIRMSPETMRNKLSLHKHLKQNNVQPYVVPDREIPLKMIISGSPKTLDYNSVKETLSCRGFAILKISHFKNRRDGKLLPSYLMELPKNVTSHEIYNVRLIFSLKVEIEKVRPAKKAP